MADFGKFLKQANLVGGEWIGADSGATIDVTNPATGDVLGTVPSRGAAETNRAIAAAAEAFKTFGRLDGAVELSWSVSAGAESVAVPVKEKRLGCSAECAPALKVPIKAGACRLVQGNEARLVAFACHLENVSHFPAFGWLLLQCVKGEVYQFVTA